VRHQHTVSKFFLKGFADEQGRLVRVPLDGGDPRVVHASNVTVVRDYYSVDLGGGPLNDRFERAFAEVEDRAAGALRAAVDGTRWPLDMHAKTRLACWIALQHLRAQAIRDAQSDVRGEMVRLLVGVSGEEALRTHIETAEGVPVGDARLAAEWADLTGAGGPTLEPDPIAHIRTILELLPGTTAMFADMQWSLDVFDDAALLTSDHPVVLLPAPEHPSWSGVGLATAAGYSLNLTRRAALVIGASPGYPDTRWQAAPAGLARSLNAAALSNATRTVLHHPDDAHLLDGVELPTQRPRTVAAGAENLIREEGLFAGLTDSQLDAQRGPQELERGTSLRDLGWPIPGRRFTWAEPGEENTR